MLLTPPRHPVTHLNLPLLLDFPTPIDAVLRAVKGTRELALRRRQAARGKIRPGTYLPSRF
ncbi:hypothetical protein EWM64_g1736 [Hericium alpestre]|uniref:Uncharacterized protein n=1 Tax=Hericium alpestre TaxID=135208 RepID=A0A4Z0A7M1_9AGAM|nr:hypothetical protein EWM64_g1736 [Hericium alpestre]